MKILILSILTISFISFSNVNESYAGNCDYSWQNASDGSNCGGRAANRRPGGRP